MNLRILVTPFLLGIKNLYHDGNIGDEFIITNSISRQYNFDEIFSETHRYQLYKKSQLVNTKEEELAELRLNVYPNPLSAGHTITFDTDIKEYNSIKILDMAGRTVIHQPVAASRNNIQAPSEKGIYYVRLYDKFTAVSKAVKLIVQ